MKKKVSLKDIAEQVGVSTALVSYVLNNKKKGRINKEVASKIRAVAKALHYSPNQLAKGLRTSKTFTIGLIVADIANPFFSKLARIIEDEAEKKGYTVIFGSSDESAEKSWKLIQVLLDRQVDGLIIAATEGSEPHLTYLQEYNIPFVLVDRYFPELRTNYVVIDNDYATASAVRHLISQGFHRPGLVTLKTTLRHLEDRKKGYLSALPQPQTAVENGWIKELPLLHSRSEVKQAVDELLALPKPVDALVFATNTLSTDGLTYINTLPLQVPENLAVVSFDESDAAYLFYAPLTHIRQPLKKIGQEAVEILFHSMEDASRITGQSITAPLILAQSTDVHLSLKRTTRP